MASFNRVNLIGNLARDPEIRYTPQQKAVCDLVLAVDDSCRTEGELGPAFFPVTVWEKQAEAVAQHLKKGSLIQVEGRLVQERWEHEGEKRSKLTVTAHFVNFLSPKAKGQAAEPAAVPSGAPDQSAEGEGDVPF